MAKCCVCLLNEYTAAASGNNRIGGKSLPEGSFAWTNVLIIQCACVCKFLSSFFPQVHATIQYSIQASLKPTQCIQWLWNHFLDFFPALHEKVLVLHDFVNLSDFVSHLFRVSVTRGIKGLNNLWKQVQGHHATIEAFIISSWLTRLFAAKR